MAPAKGTKYLIVVTHVKPPIPDFRYDWCAHHDGEEEENHCGWGTTPEEAIADLERLDDERAEAKRMNSDYAEQQGGY